jgi:hypothetical protein
MKKAARRSAKTAAPTKKVRPALAGVSAGKESAAIFKQAFRQQP